MKSLLCLTVAAATLAASSISFAQVAPDRSVKYRQSALTVMGTSFGRLNAHAKGDIKLDAAAINRNAAIVEMMSNAAPDGFLAATEQSKGTRAKADIWKEQDKFKKLWADNQAATAGLSTAAKGGDAKALQDALGKVGATCKACHDAYQSKEVIN
jgi:cytochrome c556